MCFSSGDTVLDCHHFSESGACDGMMENKETTGAPLKSTKQKDTFFWDITHKVLLHKLQLVVLAIFAFLVRELVLVRGALPRMIVAVAVSVPNLPVPVAADPLRVASLMMVVAVRGTPRGSMPAGCFFPTWAPSQPTVPSFGNARVYRVVPQKQGGLLPAIACGWTCENQISHICLLSNWWD